MRQFAIAVIQIAVFAALWQFLKHVYVPAFGVVGGLMWLAGCMALAFWLDATPWRYAVAFTLLLTVNFAVLFAVLSLWPDWRGMLWFIPFLAFGYRLANVIETRAATPHWTPGQTDTSPRPASAPASARTNRRGGKRLRFGHR
jgi:hypothetical protein